LIWNEDGTYRSVEELDQLVLSVVGDKDKEIVVYCGVGGYASTWWFVLTEVLDYKHVKIFDGAAQEWAKYYDMELD
jgi:thiosulfate/3-mercaptopyruvate sulfurtransferase